MSKRDLSWLDNSPTTLKHAPIVMTRGFQLTVTRGPDVDGGTTPTTSLTLAIDGLEACPSLIGTSEVCALRLRDPEVSRRHVSIEVVDATARLRLRDLGSTNGTRVNGIRVIEALLEGDERITVGNTEIQLSTEKRPAASSASSSPSVDEDGFGDYIGKSAAIRRLYPICRRLAKSDVPLVIEGETGTGKEALTEAIHAEGPRASKPFVIFDCTAVPATLIEAALFGYEKGAFTGASTAKAGCFEEADGGTLLIDEIGDLEKSLQSKLLRAIQSSEVRRLGGSRFIKVDVRIIAATRRDLDAEVTAGRFRDDLYFRLAVARIVLPPLRERRDDVVVLARHFWKIYGAEQPFPEDLLPRLESHPWPGNVRELANTMARLAALGDLGASGQELFMRRGGAAPPDEDGDDASHEQPRSSDFIDGVVVQSLELARSRELVQREFERRYVAHLLEVHSGDVTRAAAASGIGERYLRMIRARVR